MQTCSRRLDPAELGSGSALPAWRRGGPRPSWPAKTSPSATCRASSPGSAGRTARRSTTWPPASVCPTEHLLRGVTAREYDEIKLTLDFAELSLETGQHVEAEAQARRGARPRHASRSQDELVFRARYIIARALEGQGNLDDAILELEPLVYARQGGLLRIKCAIAMVPLLPRTPATSTQAIEVGERVMAQLRRSHVDSCRRGRPDGRDRGGRLLRARRRRPGRPHLPQGDRQGRGARLTHRPRLGVLERQHLRVRARLGQQRRPAGRARARAAGRGPGRPQPRPASHRRWVRCSSSSTRPTSRRPRGTSTRRPRSWPGAAPARRDREQRAGVAPARSLLEGDLADAEAICPQIFDVGQRRGARSTPPTPSPCWADRRGAR